MPPASGLEMKPEDHNLIYTQLFTQYLKYFIALLHMMCNFNSIISLDVTSYSAVEVHRRFGGTY
jgi:hypothetical protein